MTEERHNKQYWQQDNGEPSSTVRSVASMLRIPLLTIHGRDILVFQNSEQVQQYIHTYCETYELEKIDFHRVRLDSVLKNASVSGKRQRSISASTISHDEQSTRFGYRLIKERRENRTQFSTYWWAVAHIGSNGVRERVSAWTTRTEAIHDLQRLRGDGNGEQSTTM